MYLGKQAHGDESEHIKMQRHVYQGNTVLIEATWSSFLVHQPLSTNVLGWRYNGIENKWISSI